MDNPPIYDRLKREYSKGLYDETFVEAAREDLPLIFGRTELLEEFFHKSIWGGDPERLAQVSQQLRNHIFQPPTPKRKRPWILRLVGAT